ncbi:MAG: tRNA (5-methylaminomethyl-2-thiouridine)(34)-methyltransferase MnmD [Chitinophagaceae bacterium]|nr:tRNA (5-methylaminomethyl-2-thiouridine)(34)-methyltransferase MnmD [Chitinophagaceae bacterium]
MERIIQLTADGSHTLAIPAMEVSYHSKHGAIQESLHVFIQSGIYNTAIQNLQNIKILEIGFGTGLNAVLTAIEATKLNKTIFYASVEAYPLSSLEYQLLNYGEILNQQPLFNAIHEAEWNKMVMINAHFQLCKIHKKLDELLNSAKNGEAPSITPTPLPNTYHLSPITYSLSPIPYSLSPNTYNLIYFDAFAAVAQPELWTAEIFAHLYSLLTHNGILVTYCSKGIVRRTMESVGFTVEKIPGPPGKREMVSAVKM